jgi:hypothetical protein
MPLGAVAGWPTCNTDTERQQLPEPIGDET